ncbi:MAG: DHH family phosphoesterase [Saprospiraceae bacterium]|jgi:phosphoesterase RecJ-like protein|nr:DHH family phosphoesterase [Saprospiraceae bacterium]
MELQELQSFLRVPRDVAIVSHRNPDGDAVGSTLAIGMLLDGMGHTVHMILPSEYPNFLNWMPWINKIRIYDLQPEDVTRTLKEVDMVWMLDFNALDRIDRMGEVIHIREGLTNVMIDHHIDPEPIADYVLSETESSSTCELIFDFIHQGGWDSRISTDLATCLLCGVLTDTGSFKYNTRPVLFHKVARLLEAGVDLNDLQTRLFNNMPEKFLRLLGYCLNQRLEIIDDYHTAIISLSKEDYKVFDIQRGDTEGIVNYMLMIDKIRFAIFIAEQPTIIKLSFRSIGNFSVQEFARDHFKGGGHKNASGGSVYGTLDKTIEKIKSLLPQYAQKLQNA